MAKRVETIQLEKLRLRRENAALKEQLEDMRAQQESPRAPRPELGSATNLYSKVSEEE